MHQARAQERAQKGEKKRKKDGRFSILVKDSAEIANTARPAGARMWTRVGVRQARLTGAPKTLASSASAAPSGGASKPMLSGTIRSTVRLASKSLPAPGIATAAMASAGLACRHASTHACARVRPACALYPLVVAAVTEKGEKLNKRCLAEHLPTPRDTPRMPLRIEVGHHAWPEGNERPVPAALVHVWGALSRAARRQRALPDTSYN